MSVVAAPPPTVLPSEDGSLYTNGGTTIGERDGTLTPDGYASDGTIGPEVINLLSDDEDDIDELDEEIRDRKVSPAPTAFSNASSVNYLGAIIKNDPFIEPIVERKPQTPRRPATSPVRLTSEQEASIVALRQAGWTMPAIADHIGRSKNTVNSFLQRRQAKMNAIVGTLPGSQGVAARAPRAPRRRPSQQQQRIAGGSRAARAPQFNFKNEFDVDIKPLTKKEEPM
ncbi:Transposase IS30-like HTH domain protein [Kalmanozyma brasiliensis GHG001]|uniref:Transposase IS30-like HTH domain protein n=1 Tax=Kalmanozyma brasiliensis (strain GHG001) TaxID=1365824 RepID=UPI002867D82B|nr:Transposase IS30-like HTH domain protein [Kalmanozyma brasiliensis GHG001]KAF6766779.1 Transposase IS30-like HTH domain protein [Kalmanozyma brasiliensis GHG001]